MKEAATIFFDWLKAYALAVWTYFTGCVRRCFLLYVRIILIMAILLIIVAIFSDKTAMLLKIPTVK
jgi:hypothetical protein